MLQIYEFKQLDNNLLPKIHEIPGTTIQLLAAAVQPLHIFGSTTKFPEFKRLRGRNLG